MPFGTTPVQSVEYALYAANPSQKAPGHLWNARKRVFIGRRTLSSQAAGSQVAMVRIPSGHVVVGGKLEWTALGSSVAIIGVGDQFNCTRFMLGADGSVASYSQVGLTPFPNSCGVFNQISTAQAPLWNCGTDVNNYVGSLYQFTCDSDVIVYFSYAAAQTGYLKLTVETVTAG